MRHSIAFMTLAFAAAVSAAPAPRDAAAEAPVVSGPEVSIPFANHGGIYDWHAVDDKGIWVQDRSRKWYYGQFLGPCIGIQFALRVGFKSDASGTLDRWGQVYTKDAGRCALTSLKASEPPPGYKPKAKAKAAS